jgi:thiamine-monophosphate kinase
MTSELDFITALRKLPLHDGARRLQDDCAVLEVGGETLILTSDSMASGVHFRADADPYDIAWKLVATNLSDLAAKGAEPLGIMLNYSLGDKDARFLEGLAAILERYDVPLLGGDTISAKSSPTHSLTALGSATHTPVPARSGAKAGDRVYVTGTLGRAMLGFEDDPAHLEAFNRPTPLLSEGRSLAAHVTAMMDISDGLLLDAHRMAEASGAAFELKRECIPVADPARFDECIRWGDDYQLLFTAPPETSLPIACTPIGAVSSADFATLLLDDDILTPSNGLGHEHSPNPPS